MNTLRFGLTFAAATLSSAPVAFCQYGAEEVLISFGGVVDCVPIDGDLDGDLDVMIASQNTGSLRYLENIGDDTFGQPLDPGIVVPGLKSMEPVDLDGDGAVDLLFSESVGDFVWTRNAGNGTFGMPQVIEASYSVRSALALDWDADGDLDILAASTSSIDFFENTGGTVGPRQSFVSGPSGIEGLAAADLNGDGLMDLVVARGNTVAWYPGLTSSTFGPEDLITTGAGGASDVLASDLNGDGALDVAVSASTDGEVAWFQGNGAGGFGGQQLVDVSAGGVDDLRALDFNDDGLMDLVAGPRATTYVVYENLGFGFFNVPQPIVTNAGTITSLRFADMDGDADADVVTSSINVSRASLFRNISTIGTTYCTSNPNSTGVAAELAVTGFDKAQNNAIVLSTTELPPSSFGFYITSQSSGMVSGPGGSQGILCLGGSIGRYVGPGQIQFSGALRRMRLAIDLQTMPTPTGSFGASPGETWYFQTWYRDTVAGTPTSNFSDAVSVMLL